ncbi:MAG: hypothetical protein AAFZ17_19555 [Cyanobacteria bacterium J06650_10]
MKIRFSKRGWSYLLFRARTLDVVESVRRLNGDPVAEAEAVLKKADANQKLASAKDIDSPSQDRRIFMPAYRRDGVGIQALVRICVMFLARQVNATYFHIPFLALQHQFNDPVGQALSVLEWAEKWEAFLNLGQGEPPISALVKQGDRQALARKMADENHQFGKPGVPMRVDLSNFLREASGDSTLLKDISVFDLPFFRDTTSKLRFDADFVETLQAKFEANGYVPRQLLYSDQYLDVAIHVRRGDIWESYQAGKQKLGEKIRFISEDYYVTLLQRLQSFFHTSSKVPSNNFSKPVRFHIFSDGTAADFPQFTFVNQAEAYLNTPSGMRIENIQFHLSQNSLDALYHLVKAPVLVPAKSSFSFLAVLLGKSRVLYDDQIREFYQYDFLADYMKNNSRFILLDDLKQQKRKVLSLFVRK